MPPTNPRIIVVDDNQGIYNIIQMALELMGRRPRLIYTHTGDDALLELRISSADLLVTAHKLSGTTNGPMLALMAKRELAALPVIVMANEDDPEIDAETLSQSPFQYLRRPYVPEVMLRTLRIALDGPESVPQDVHLEDMGPVPVVDLDKLRPILFAMMRDVGAMAAVLADRNGKVLAYEGAAGYIDRDLLAAALGPGFGNTAKLLSVVGNQPRVLKFFDGDKGSLFGLAVGLHHFVMLIFDTAAPAGALGSVTRSGKTSINEMLAVIGDGAFRKSGSTSAPALAAAKPADKTTEPALARSKTRTQAAVAAPAPAKPAERPVPEKKASASKQAAQPAAQPAAPIANFDPNLLDALNKVDLTAADDLFDPDKLAAANSGQGTNKISFEDAMLQGIIGDMEE